MVIVRDDLWLCECCLFAAVNGDSCSCDGHDVKVTAGLERLGAHLVPDFDTETGAGTDEFSRVACAGCSTRLGGLRYRFAVLEEGAAS